MSESHILALIASEGDSLKSTEALLDQLNLFPFLLSELSKVGGSSLKVTAVGSQTEF